jgi:hypothetical protein
MVALSPIISSPELQSTLKTLASSPEAVSALNNVADAVEKSKESADGGKAVELISRLDSIEANIKTIEDFHIDELVKKIEDLKSGTPSLEALDTAIKKTTDELTKRGDEAISKEVDKLSSKLSDQIISTNQPINVRMGNAENSILSLNTKIDTAITDVSSLKVDNVVNKANILSLQTFQTTQDAINDSLATNTALQTTNDAVSAINTRVNSLEHNSITPDF